MLKTKGKKKQTEVEKQSTSKLHVPSIRRLSVGMSSRTVMDSRTRIQAQSRGPRRMRDDDVTEGSHEEEWAAGPVELIKPDNQLELTEQELKEEFTRVLTANNPHAPGNIIRFSHKENTFKTVASIDQLAIHFTLESNLLHKESDEAQRQLTVDDGSESEEEKQEDDDEEDEGAEGEKKAKGADEKPSEEQEGGSAKGKKLRNQFNFSERASQTYNNPLRERGTITEPPPRANFSATANQMEIFDSYLEDLAKQEKAKEKKTTRTVGRDYKQQKQRSSGLEIQSDDIGRVARAAKVMERMVNQNTYDSTSQDFKYYNDPADEYRDGHGTLLPLWRFRYEKAHKKSITAICWNPKYHDMFGVGHGSYDFAEYSGVGFICFHSLKNPTYPEITYSLSTGVMSMDIHPEHSSLVAVGLYDGTVAVYNLQNKSSFPVLRSTAKSGKHTDPVWQVAWQKNDMEGNLNFMSVSSDGRVVSWSIVKNELRYEDIMILHFPGESVKQADGIQTKQISLGTAMCINLHADHMYLVGSEEGKIYKCSKAFKDRYVEVYHAHHMAIHGLKWNPFHPNIFASCGADWTVKIWDHTRKDPMFSYDLSSVVGDVAWSPYSATVFAAVTAEGKVYVFDMTANKYEPIASQNVHMKKHCQLTHVTFNQIHPVLLVGDERGSVISLKLSPNLRKAMQEKNRSAESERAKMEKLISFVKEPLLELEG